MPTEQRHQPHWTQDSRTSGIGISAVRAAVCRSERSNAERFAQSDADRLPYADTDCCTD